MKSVFMLMVCLWGGAVCAQQAGSTLVSGEPIKNGTPGGIGIFKSPSLTGAIMGTADVDGDGNSDLFLKGDARKRGIYLYHFKKLTKEGVPVFSQGIDIKYPKEMTTARTVILQLENNDVIGFFRSGGRSIRRVSFDKSNNEFVSLNNNIKINGLPKVMSSFGVMQTTHGGYLFLFSVAKDHDKPLIKMATDSVYYTPEGYWPNELNNIGVYGAFTNNLEDLSQLEAKPLTDLEEVYYGISGYTSYINSQKEQYVIAGTRFGNIHAYQVGKDGFVSSKYIVDADHILHRSPTVNGYPGYFRGAGAEGLLLSGEGGVFFYPNNKQKDSNGNLVFGEPSFAFQENPDLYGGSLVVPSLADWDGDGKLDIISGNSAGNLFFFRNIGTNQTPAFNNPEPVKAGGIDIHIQPGYREDIQGPQEARWGYVCPVVYDWNGDGLPDILTGDSRGKFMVFINKGTKDKPNLEVERPLYFKGLNVHGGWRSTPGVADMAGKDAYVILDRDNQFHLYYKIDAYNIADGGKLRLADGSYINGHRRKGGQVGRAKIHIVDWDGDGVKDMLVGTGRGASIPNPTTGLPYNRKKKNEGAAVLFLKNVGTDAEPVFEFPKMMKFKGHDILLGAHECAPTTGYIGGDGKTLNLIVGTEYGTYMFYDRKDLSW